MTCPGRDAAWSHSASKTRYGGTVRRRSGTVTNTEFDTVPGLQRTTPLRYVAHCARDTRGISLESRA